LSRPKEAASTMADSGSSNGLRPDWTRSL